MLSFRYLYFIIPFLSLTYCSLSPNSTEIPPTFAASIYDQEPSWSPSGDKIAFYRGSTEMGVSGLYIMNSDGSNIKFVAYLGRAPKWAPQGDRVLYRTLTDIQLYIYDILADTSAILFYDNYKKIDATWYPSGEAIIYSIHTGEDSIAGIWKYDLNTWSAQRIVPIWSRFPCISPLGSHIIFIEHTSTSDYLSIAALYPDSIGSVNRLVSDYQLNTSNIEYPSFNNDGTNILFQVNSNIASEHSIYLFNIYNDSITHIVDGGITPAWCHDNNNIIYTRFLIHKTNITGNGYLWIMNINTRDTWQVTFP